MNPPETDAATSVLLRTAKGLVPRPHLLERLDEGRARQLTLVSGSAGFGKTTLVSA